MIRSPADPAVERFIDRSMAVRIATLSPAGNADLIPLWFVQHRGRLYMMPRAGSPVVRDIQANPEVVLIFHGEKRSKRDRVLRVRGHASWVSDRRTVRPAIMRAVARYYLSPGGLWNTLTNIRGLPMRFRYYRERSGEAGAIEVITESAEFLRLP
ncbi:MAG TPA: pyridoxamine 5'-phosphate oxidase family protein [Tepidiformaceae bacterium]|nr:pyridoxamine 5'-phosphate oxidase family protein [Tepidiformaceae bacterium]